MSYLPAIAPTVIGGVALILLFARQALRVLRDWAAPTGPVELHVPREHASDQATASQAYRVAVRASRHDIGAWG